MSSLKMTFSLTSLILLIALGLVFAPVSVMADDGDPGADHSANGHASAGTLTAHVHPMVSVSSANADDEAGKIGFTFMDTDDDDAETGDTATFKLKFMFTTADGDDADTDPDAVIVDGGTLTALAANMFTLYKADGTAIGSDDITVSAVTALDNDDNATTTTVANSNMYTSMVTLTKAGTAPTGGFSTIGIIALNVPNSLGVGAIEFDTTTLMDLPTHEAGNLATTVRFKTSAAPSAAKKATVTVAANTYHGSKRFMVTIETTEALAAELTVDDIDPGDKARVLPGSIKVVTAKMKWTAIIEPLLLDETGDIMVTVKGDNVQPAAENGSVTVMHAAVAAGTRDVTSNLSGSIPAKGFAVISRSGDIDGLADSVNEIALATLPDLQRFLALRGSITLYGTGIADRNLVISEIMWGRDLNGDPSGDDERDDHQWIEVYNSTTAAIDLSNVQIEFSSATVVPTATNLIDQFSNIERTGWAVTQGQDGALSDPDREGEPLKNLVSMYRNIDYKKVEKGDHDSDATKNRNKQLEGIPNGKASGSWLKSIDQDTFALNRIGSPGEKHTVTTSDFDATNVARNAVIITEVGNNGNDDYDWIELTAIAKTNLEKYELQYIKEKDDGTGEVVVLAQFVKKDLEAGDILVVHKTDPLGNNNHPVAAGKMWKDADENRENRGVDSLYHVDSRMVIPNDLGKALFVLRNEKGKTNHENIVDIAGNLFITDRSDAYRTDFWPLRATAAGHGNVIKDVDENFNSGKVYQRDARNGGLGNVGDGGAHENDWSVRGFTGIGYKRSATNNAQNGGTPGFDNGALKEKNTVLTTAGDAGVSISEIMYDRGSRDNLVQWIELYNSSKTLAVNLAGWKLKIENADDVDVREPALTIKDLGGTIIQPNQTVLIVAYKRANHSKTFGTSDFPAHRLIDLSGKDELEILPEEKRDYRLLSATAFKITLMEKDAAATAAPVDVAGNLGADGTAMWELPTAMNGEIGRSSIIRRYNEGKATTGGDGEAMGGTMPVWSGAGALGDAGGIGNAGWILASESLLSGVHVEHTYYGTRSDVGTPGYRDGGPLPVSLSKFRPERLKDTGEIVVRWITESELNNAGFNILRSEKRDSGFTKVHYVAGQGTTSERTVYEWKDKSAKPNVVYYYQIQDVSLDGEVTTLRTTHLRGNVTAAGKATTTWGEIKALQ